MSNELSLGFTEAAKETQDTSLQTVAESRAIAEVQSAYVIAKRFPRNPHDSYMNILEACKRPFLAEQAMYAYPRGGTLVKGPSIRLAETLAQCWGNLDCGVREISQSNGVSVAEAYAIDLQTNTRITKVFHVQHKRDTKKGTVRLTDSRDIYELVANQGSRRLRACILGIIPGDVIEAAVERCARTLETSDTPIADQIRKLVVAFDEIGVKTENLEKRLGHKLEATIPQEIVTLRGIYKSIKDGMAKREDFFDGFATTKSEDAKMELQQAIQKNTGVNHANGQNGFKENSVSDIESSNSSVSQGETMEPAQQAVQNKEHSDLAGTRDTQNQPNVAVDTTPISQQTMELIRDIIYERKIPETRLESALKVYGTLSIEELTEEDAQKMVKIFRKNKESV